MSLDDEINELNKLAEEIDSDSQQNDFFSAARERKENNDIDGAIDLYEKIKRSNNEEENERYAHTQIELSTLYGLKQNFEKVKQSYQNIKENDSKELYGLAQYNLGLVFWEENNTEEARLAFLNIQSESVESSVYEIAQFMLGTLSERPTDTVKYWNNISKKSSIYFIFRYQIGIITQINEKVANDAKKEKLLSIFSLVDLLMESLHVNLPIEAFLAHYTDLTISKLLISKEEKSKEFKPKSELRLGMINLMNDPTEGSLLNKILCLKDEIQTTDLAFISCFTLHHDSLNQFRLYGKSDKQEATGLSLVLAKDFFAQEHNIAQMINKIETTKLSSDEEELKIKEKDNKLPKMPLYRCIYVDPTSGLIKIAQREEWSFHREYKTEKKESILESNLKAEENWKKYQYEILKIESEVTTHLKALVQQVKLLNPKDLNDEEKELLAEILLPLRYLIKHMAFKEEQECRMIYVTQMDNPLIKYDEKINRIYIDYKPSVMEHLEKIYLTPKAKDEKMVFEYLCSRGQEIRKGKSPVKVKISQNPFR